jgi:hypothetical protein
MDLCINSREISLLRNIYLLIQEFRALKTALIVAVS